MGICCGHIIICSGYIVCVLWVYVVGSLHHICCGYMMWGHRPYVSWVYVVGTILAICSGYILCVLWVYVVGALHIYIVGIICSGYILLCVLWVYVVGELYHICSVYMMWGHCPYVSCVYVVDTLLYVVGTYCESCGYMLWGHCPYA